MLSRWRRGAGGSPGMGGGFDVTSLPVVGTFDHSPSPEILAVPASTKPGSDHGSDHGSDQKENPKF